MSHRSKESDKALQRNGLGKAIKDHYILYIFLLPALVYIIIFSYLPMYGIQIAFKNYTISKGFTDSPWAGFKWFNLFFSSRLFYSVLKNTLAISIYALIAGFPIPIILALMLNYVSNIKFKKALQTITYLPHFISVVVIVGMLSSFLSPRSGFINEMIQSLGGKPIYFFGDPDYFRHIYVWSGVWQGAGWGSIIYMASLSSVNPELHESCIIDGANILQRIWHVDIPSIMPTMVIMLILSCGSIMNVGYEKTYLMQNNLNLKVSEVISTYTYKMGLLQQKYSYSSAIGLFNNIVNFALLNIVNYIAKKISGNSLW